MVSVLSLFHDDFHNYQNEQLRNHQSCVGCVDIFDRFQHENSLRCFFCENVKIIVLVIFFLKFCYLDLIVHERWFDSEFVEDVNLGSEQSDKVRIVYWVETIEPKVSE